MQYASLGGSNAGSYIAAGKAVADSAAEIHYNQRKYGPDYAGLSKVAMAAQTAENIAATQAEQVVTSKAIDAFKTAHRGQTLGEGYQKLGKQETKQRMAGILPAVGKIVGSAFKKDPKRPPPLLQVPQVAPERVPYPTGEGRRTAPPKLPTLDDIPGADGIDTPTAGAAKLVPTDGIRTEAYNYLISKHGLSRNKALGIIANIDRESSFRPSIESGDDGGAGGLFQWFGSRQTPKVQELVRTGDWKGQIDYALSEPGEPYSRTYQETTFDSPQAAADGWMINFERPLHPPRDSRRHAELLSGYSF
jgi:hypothetical protein